MLLLCKGEWGVREKGQGEEEEEAAMLMARELLPPALD